jgi:uncharacterized RDD family membrane protein YckC
MTDPITPPPDPMPPVEPTPAPPPPAPAPSGSGRPADIGPRFLARLIDHILLAIVTSVIIVPLLIASALAELVPVPGSASASISELVR